MCASPRSYSQYSVIRTVQIAELALQAAEFKTPASLLHSCIMVNVSIPQIISSCDIQYTQHGVGA